MAGDIELQIAGFAELKRILAELPDKLRRRALRNALAAGARLVRDAARRQAPIISAGDPAVARGERAPGTVANAVRVRTSKQAKAAGNVGVFVNVLPAKGAVVRKGKVVRGSQRGAKKPTDPFYWRFLEFGTKKMRPMPYLRPAASTLGDALRLFEATLGPQIQRLNNNPKDPL